MRKIYAFADEASHIIDEQITAMKRNGLAGLEIRNVDDVNVSDITLDKAKEVKKKLDDAGLITWAIGSPIGKIRFGVDDFSEHLEKFKHTIEIARILGSGNIRLFSFYPPKGEDAAPYKNEVIDRLGQFVETAKGSGIDLCHENEKGIYGDTAARCLELHKAIPDLKAVFDPANFVQCGQDTLEAWEKLHSHVHYMHIKDALPNGNVVAPGDGDGNVPARIAKYFAQGGEVLSLEPHLFEFVGLKALEREGEKSVVGALSFETAEAAFDHAADKLKNILEEIV